MSKLLFFFFKISVKFKMFIFIRELVAKVTHGSRENADE